MFDSNETALHLFEENLSDEFLSMFFSPGMTFSIPPLVLMHLTSCEAEDQVAQGLTLRLVELPVVRGESLAGNK